VPGARILQIDPNGQIEQVSYDQADPVALTRGFLNDPDQFLHYLFSDKDVSCPMTRSALRCSGMAIPG